MSVEELRLAWVQAAPYSSPSLDGLASLQTNPHFQLFPLHQYEKSTEIDLVLLLAHDLPTTLEQLHALQQSFRDMPIVVLAAQFKAKDLLKLVQAGAHDVLLTDFKQGLDLPKRLQQIYRLHQEKTLVASLKDPTLCYVGETVTKIYRTIPRIIMSAINTIYIEGETGTGKEVIADLFAKALPESTPFLRINCGAIAPQLVSSEFFGHAKGAFTGALSTRVGLLEQAHGGYLFLDEVTNLSLTAQAALLRAIENGEIVRVGETQPRPVRVRIISATNEPLAEAVKEGRFRQDLWQRLTEKTIYLPPLRHRRHEIPALIDMMASTMQGGPYQVTPAAKEVLASLPWDQGNIRQLRNCLRAMTEYQMEGTLGLQALPQEILNQLHDSGLKRVVSLAERRREPSEQSLTLEWEAGTDPCYDELCDQLLLKLIERQTRAIDKVSLRKLASSIGMVRNTLSNRMRALAKKNILQHQDMLKLIGES